MKQALDSLYNRFKAGDTSFTRADVDLLDRLRSQAIAHDAERQSALLALAARWESRHTTLYAEGEIDKADGIRMVVHEIRLELKKQGSQEPTATCSTCSAVMVRQPDGTWQCPLDRRHGDRMWPDEPQVNIDVTKLLPGEHDYRIGVEGIARHAPDCRACRRQ